VHALIAPPSRPAWPSKSSWPRTRRPHTFHASRSINIGMQPLRMNVMSIKFDSCTCLFGTSGHVVSKAHWFRCDCQVGVRRLARGIGSNLPRYGIISICAFFAPRFDTVNAKNVALFCYIFWHVLLKTRPICSAEHACKDSRHTKQSRWGYIAIKKTSVSILKPHVCW
jgi:hypothetical protein